MVAIQQGLRQEGIEVSMVRLCRWFGVARRTVYYRPTKSAPKVNPALAEPIKTMIEAEPSFGYRTVAGLLRLNKNTVQRIFQIKGWQVRKRSIGSRPRIQALAISLTCLLLTCTACGPLFAQGVGSELKPIAFATLDTDKDGKLSLREARADPGLSMAFETLDVNHIVS